MESCEEIARALADAIEGLLDAERQRRFDAHLAICPDCVTYLDQYCAAISLARASGAPRLPARPPQALIDAVREALREDQPPTGAC